MFSAALAAFVTLASTSPAPQPAALPAPRVIRRLSGRHRFVRLLLDVEGDGVRGTETGIYDLETGRSVERVAAGPLSGAEGFDGARAWSADATGMPVVTGNADDRLDQIAWAHFFGRLGPEQPRVTVLRGRGADVVVRLRYAGLSGPIDVTLNRTTGSIAAIVDSTRGESGRSRFAEYRRVDDVLVPYRVDAFTRYGAFHERVRRVDFPATVPEDAFAPPARPNDAELDGVTSVPLEMRRGHPVVALRIDGGPVLHMLFDTGAANMLTPAAARRTGLRTIGEGKIGGMGPGVVRERYAKAHAVVIGGALLRDQPFSVVDEGITGLDGTIGCEVLQRFAVRFDVRRETVELARDAAAFGIHSAPIPFRFSGCQPEVDGSLDGMPGAISIDTGDANAFDVTAPFVRKHNLVRRYGTKDIGFANGIGGASFGFLAHARVLRLGPVAVRDVPIILSAATSGALNDPAELGNAGMPLLGRFVIVFDYRNSRMWLLR